MGARVEGVVRNYMKRFVFALAIAGAIGAARARDAASSRSLDRRRRLLADVTGSAFFDVFGFELSASAVFDPVCELINPWLHPDYRLRACVGEVAGVEDGADESYVEGEFAPEGSFVNGPTGNVAGGIGGGSIGGVAGGSAGFVGGGVGIGGVSGRRRR